MAASRLRKLLPWIVLSAVMALLTVQLRFQGRIWWCACGRVNLWSGQVQSQHNSQHLFDPYSFTHVPHGIAFFVLLAWLFPRWPLAWRLVTATGLESCWEVIENTSYVIERYRTATLALDYYGDSIVNSLADVLSSDIGFLLVYRLKWRGSLLLFFLFEALTAVWIRDNLILNILMLLVPIDAIKEWQMAG